MSIFTARMNIQAVRMKLNFLALWSAVVLIFSCSSDSENAPEETASIVGVWDAVEYGTTEPIDYNGDGVVSYDIMEEIVCFSETWIFNEDATYSGTITEYTTAIGNLPAECTGVVEFSGNYSLNGNKLTINRSNGSSYTLEIVLTESTFSYVPESLGLGVLTVVYRKRD